MTHFYFHSCPAWAFRLTAVAVGVVLQGVVFCPTASWAQGIATEAQLKPVEVNGDYAVAGGLDANLPTSTASKTSQQLAEQGVFNPEDAAQNLPSITIRKRYLGDRNANVGGRSHGVLEPGRGLVYVDGYLISSFLGRFDAPRWNMINTEAIERVDALYGPFSAIYPGNSIGTTLIVTERKPKGLEASVSLKYNRQSFKEYGYKDRLSSQELSARLAAKADNGLWWSVAYQDQASNGQPMGYGNLVRGVAPAATNFVAPTTGTQVTGMVYDQDPNGRDRAILGATGMDNSKQQTLNVRLGYALSATQEVEVRASAWQSDSSVRNQTTLRDAAGNPVWSGAVRDNQYQFLVPANTFAPSQRDENHQQLGMTWKTKHATGWNASVVATQYDILGDTNRQANLSQPLADAGGAGSVTRRDGTGWNTFEVQTAYTPVAGDWGDGRHALVLGLHRNAYQLSNVVNNASNWITTETTQDQLYKGHTRVTSAYAQDAWKLHPDWVLTTGARFERFESTNGYQAATGVPAVNYADRTLQATSPKLSVSWAAADDWLLKASMGRGVRFPNVDELFNGTKSGTSIVQNDPNLKPEVSNAFELSAETFWGLNSVRTSVFRDNVHNAILRQSDSTVTPSVTRVSNVDRVLTNGLEVVWQLRDVASGWGFKGVDVGGSSTWADATVKANTANPAAVGKNWPRIPKQRHMLQAGYRPSEQWLLGTQWRWAGRMYNTDTNIDINPDGYGGTSGVNQLDVKATRYFGNGWQWALGINNLNNSQAWQAHSLPQRSYYTEIRWVLK